MRKKYTFLNFAILAVLATSVRASAENPCTEGNLAFHEASENLACGVSEVPALPTGAKEFDVDLPKPDNSRVVNAADFGLNESVENAATIINAALAECRRTGASKLVMPKGTYKCFDAVSINLEGFTDFTLDFCGSKLVYYSKSNKSAKPLAGWNTFRNASNCNIKIKNCLRTKVCNAAFDWDWSRDPLGSFAKVVAKKTDSPKPYIDLKFWQYDKYPTFGKKVSVVSVAAFLDDLSAFHPSRAGAFFPAPEPIHLAEGYNTAESEWLSDNVLRLYVKSGYAFVVGGTYRVMHYYVGKNCVDMYANKHLTLENIDILSCRGHALHVDEGQQYWQYVNVNVAPPAGDERRAVSSSADHNHISNSRGFLKILGCTFSMGQDDGANIHDRSFFMKRVGERTLESANSRGIEYFNPKVGDTLELYGDDYSPTGYRGKILSIEGDRLRFDAPLPEQKGDGFVCFNSKYGTRNIIIRNCRYVRHGCRGLLLPAKDVIVENTVFEREQMGAIKLETGYTKNLWCEGYGVDNVVVRNCTFKQCNLRAYKNCGFVRDIMLGVYIKTDPSDIQPKNAVIKNVLFENNKFLDTRGVVATISCAENVRFINNEIRNDCDYPDNLWYRGSFYVQSSKNVEISGNRFVKSKKTPYLGVIEKRGTVQNLRMTHNTISEK